MIVAWSDIVALVIVLACIAVVGTYIAVNQKNKVIEWLIYAVTEAEKQLGGGTGALKLRLCYDWFVEKFPVIAAVVPFGVFSAWVDIALDTMKTWLKSNSNVANYIEGGK